MIVKELYKDLELQRLNTAVEASSRKEQYSEKVRFTPEECRKHLVNMVSNQRPLNRKKIARMAGDMKSGEFKLNGETLQETPDGKWLNGQHRFHACILAGVPFTSWVVRNVPPEVMNTIDTGKARYGYDVLAMHGVSSYASVAAVIAWIHKIRPEGGTLLNTDLSNESYIDWYDQHPEISDSVRLCAPFQKTLITSLAAALHWMFSQKSKMQADRFFCDMKSGSNLDANDPVLILRERLLKIKITREKVTQEDIPTLVIRAWNFRRNNKQTTK